MQTLSGLQLVPTYVIATLVFILLFVFYLIGYRVRQEVIRRNPDQAKLDLKAINGILLGLLGLLLAFTFGMSNTRYSTRRDIMIHEANAIATAIMRTDLYPDSVKKLLRDNLKEYVELRIAYFEDGTKWEKVLQDYNDGEKVGERVWHIAVDYAKKDKQTTIASQLLPAVTDMLHVAKSRRAAGEGTIPDSIVYFLFVLCWCASFLLGYDHKDKIDWIVVTGFAIMLSATVFNIMDLDRPRSGLIQLDTVNQKIVELREMFAHD